MENKKYNIAISHAGKDSKYIASVIAQLRSLLPVDKYRVFYDKDNYEDIEGTGNLSAYLRNVFLNKADFIIVFASQNYNEGKYAIMEFSHIWGRYKNYPSKENIVWITCDGIIPDKLKNEGAVPIDMRERSDKEILNSILHKIQKSQGIDCCLFNTENSLSNYDHNASIIWNMLGASKKTETVSYSINDIGGDQYNNGSTNRSFGNNNTFNAPIFIESKDDK